MYLPSFCTHCYKPCLVQHASFAVCEKCQLNHSVLTAWILNACGWGDPTEWFSPVLHRSEARLVIQSELWRLQGKEDNHAAALGILALSNLSFSSVSSLLYSCSAAWLWRKEAHVLTSFHIQKLPCLLSFSSNLTQVPLISFCTHGFLLWLWLVGRCKSTFWLEFLFCALLCPSTGS